MLRHCALRSIDYRLCGKEDIPDHDNLLQTDRVRIVFTNRITKMYLGLDVFSVKFGKFQSGLLPKFFRLSLRPDDHLADSVAILAGNLECLGDAIHLTHMRNQRGKPVRMRRQEFKSCVRLVV